MTAPQRLERAPALDFEEAGARWPVLVDEEGRTWTYDDPEAGPGVLCPCAPWSDAPPPARWPRFGEDWPR